MVTSKSPLKIQAAVKVNTSAVSLVHLLLCHLQQLLIYNTLFQKHIAFRHRMITMLYSKVCIKTQNLSCTNIEATVPKLAQLLCEITQTL